MDIGIVRTIGAIAEMMQRDLPLITLSLKAGR